MRNIDRLRAMSVEELAPLLVSTDYTIDEDSMFLRQEVYISPDETRHYFYEDAVEVTIEWLNKEV